MSLFYVPAGSLVRQTRDAAYVPESNRVDAGLLFSWDSLVQRHCLHFSSRDEVT